MEEEDWGAFGDGADDFGAFDGAGPAPDELGVPWWIPHAISRMGCGPLIE